MQPIPLCSEPFLHEVHPKATVTSPWSVQARTGQADFCFPACLGLWVQVWTQLLTDIVSDPISQQMTMVDILNEPDSRGLRCSIGLSFPNQLWLPHASSTWLASVLTSNNHSVRRRWQGSSPDMTTLYLQAMDSMYKVKMHPGPLSPQDCIQGPAMVLPALSLLHPQAVISRSMKIGFGFWVFSAW